MINNKNLVWYKFFANTFEKEELQQLMGEEGATGAGTFMIINEYLFNCDNAVGSISALSRLAVKCHKSKSYLLHILRDYGLYVIKDRRFYCLLLNKSLGIGEQKNHPKTDCNSSVNERGLNHESISESSSHLNTTRVRTRIEENRKEKDKPSTPSVVKGGGAGAEALSDFVNEIFEDAAWTSVLKERRGIDLNDKDVMNIVKQEFLETCIVNGKQPGIDGFDTTEARRYCYRWLNNSHENRRQLDQKIQAMIRERNRNDNPVSNYSEEYGFGYIIDGRRYSLFGDIVPMDAPPCRDRRQHWNRSLNKWVK